LIVPAVADAIASEIGHGAPGLRDGLRPLDELVTSSSAQQQVFVQLRGGRLLFGWTAGAGGTYSASIDVTVAGVQRDVVAVKTLSAELRRVQTAALCQTTNDSYFYEPGAGAITVRYGAGTSPAGADLLALLSVTVGTHSVSHPSLGEEMLTDGGLEAWSSTSNLTSWTEGAVHAGGGAVARDMQLDGGGAYAAKISGSLNAAGGYGISQAGKVGVSGKMYRASGWYKTSQANPAGVTPRVRVGYAANYLQSDGRTTEASGVGFDLANAGGEWRRFAFDFVCPGDTTELQLIGFAWNASGGALTADGVWFDGLSLRRVYCFEHYDARLSLGQLPTVLERFSDDYYGFTVRGSGTLTMLNNDGALDQVFGALEVVGQHFSLLIGGRYPDGGNEILLEDCHTRLVGLCTEEPRVTREEAAVAFEDVQALLATKLPPNGYPAELSSVALRDVDRRRPLVFGAVTGATPVLFNTAGYGVWELLDMTSAPYARFHSVEVGSVPVLYAFADEDAAAKGDYTRAVALNSAEHGGATIDWANGRVTLGNCPQLIEITAENNLIEFFVQPAGDPPPDWEPTYYVGVIPPGLYLIGRRAGSIATSADYGLLTAVIDAMNAAYGSNTGLSATFSATTNKVSFTDPNAWAIAVEGPHRERSICRALGLTGRQNYYLGYAMSPGAETVEAESSIWGGVERVTLRASFGGYLDDAAGSYTGAAYAQVSLVSDVMRCLLERWCGVPPSLVDAASFAAGRTTRPRTVSLYLGVPGEEPREARFILAELCAAGDADLVFERGKFRFKLRERHRLGVTSALADGDFIGLPQGSFVPRHSTVTVGYAQDPSTGRRKTTSETRARVRLLAGQASEKVLDTNLAALADAAAARATVAADATRRRRLFGGTVKGALLLAPLGARALLSLERAVGVSGAVESMLVRLAGKVDNVGDWTSAVDLVEVAEVGALARFCAHASTAGVGAFVWDTEHINGDPSSITRQSGNTQVRLSAGSYVVSVGVTVNGLAADAAVSAVLSVNGVAVASQGSAGNVSGEASIGIPMVPINAADGDYLSVVNTAGSRFGNASHYSYLSVVKLT
jgi:hypothetical protein